MPAPKTASHTIIHNVSWNMLGQGLIILLTFFSTPYLIRMMGVDIYGVYTLTTVLVGYFAFLQFGLIHSIIKYISQYLADNDQENIRRAFWSCIILYVGLGSAGAACIIAIMPFLAVTVFKFSPSLIDTAVLVLRIGALALPLTMINGILNGTLRATLRFDIINKIMVTSGVTQIASTVTLLYCHYSLVAVISANIVILCLTLAAYATAVMRLMPYMGTPTWTPAILRQMLSFGGYVTVLSITQPILENTEKIFLTSLRSVASLTYYYIPSTIIARLLIIPSSVLNVLFPVFSGYHAQGQSEINADLHFRSALYMGYVYMFVLALFYFFGASFFTLWISREFAQASTPILDILLIGGFINTIGLPSSTLLLGIGKPHLPALFNVIEVVIYVPVSYLLIKQYGSIGAAGSWAGCIALNTVLLNTFACRETTIRIFGFYGSLARSFALPALVCVAGFFGIRYLNASIIHPVTIALTVLLGLIYLTTIYFTGLDVFARRKFTETVRQGLAKTGIIKLTE